MQRCTSCSRYSFGRAGRLEWMMLCPLSVSIVLWVGWSEISCLLHRTKGCLLFNMKNYRAHCYETKGCFWKACTRAHLHTHSNGKQWIWESKKWLSLVTLELAGQQKVINGANRAKPSYWLIYKTINFPLKIQIKILSALGNQCLQILIGLDIKCLT